MFSDLINLFDESSETCVLKSLSTVLHKKTQIITTVTAFNSFTELNFLTIIVQTP